MDDKTQADRAGSTDLGEGGKARRPYRAPALREYGPLRDLTAGGSGTMSEIPDMNKNRFP